MQDLPGYCPAGHQGAQPTLTLAAFEDRFRTWLLSDYHQRVDIFMSEEPETKELEFAATKEYLRFGEFCDACRKYRYIGICFG